jgi:hypothetical protein
VTQKVLIGLQMQLQQLDGKFDEIGVRGLTGESPLRSRKRSMLERCERLQTEVVSKLQAVQGAQHTPAICTDIWNVYLSDDSADCDDTSPSIPGRPASSCEVCEVCEVRKVCGFCEVCGACEVCEVCVVCEFCARAGSVDTVSDDESIDTMPLRDVRSQHTTVRAAQIATDAAMRNTDEDNARCMADVSAKSRRRSDPVRAAPTLPPAARQRVRLGQRSNGANGSVTTDSDPYTQLNGEASGEAMTTAPASLHTGVTFADGLLRIHSNPHTQLPDLVNCAKMYIR